MRQMLKNAHGLFGNFILSWLISTTAVTTSHWTDSDSQTSKFQRFIHLQYMKTLLTNLISSNPFNI
jgi:hypothetical protein